MTVQSLPLPAFAPARLDAAPTLTPFLKWPGGKTQELPEIAAAAPDLVGRLIDPFVGGGSILFATPAGVPAMVNDACADLMGLYSSAASEDPLFQAAVLELAGAWESLGSLEGMYEGLAGAFIGRSDAELLAVLARSTPEMRHILDPAGVRLAESFLARVGNEVTAKFERMRRVEIKVGRSLTQYDLLANIEGAVRSSFYMSVRSRYNDARRAETWGVTRLADFFFLREFTYAAMFRFNARNEFNVPYGGITYNRKLLSSKARQLFGAPMLARLANTAFSCQDFEPFLADANLTTTDFVFVDPPYDSDFSAYDNRAFEAIDQRRLQAVLADLPSHVMVVIKDTPSIRNLYSPDRWHIVEADKTYMWTIKSRNDRAATHLTITNYLLDDA